MFTQCLIYGKIIISPKNTEVKLRRINIVYYHVTFIIDGNINDETVVKANNSKKAGEELNDYFKKTNMTIEIVDIRESKYMEEN